MVVIVRIHFVILKKEGVHDAEIELLPDLGVENLVAEELVGSLVWNGNVGGVLMGREFLRFVGGFEAHRAPADGVGGVTVPSGREPRRAMGHVLDKYIWNL